MSDQHVYRYTGDGGARLPGIPKRDLTAADVDRLTRQGLLAEVKGSSLYEKVKSEPPKDTQTKADKTAKTEGGES